MKNKVRKAKKGQAGATGPNRAQGNFKQNTVKSEKLSAFKYDDKPGVIMSSKTEKEGHADRELRRMMQGDVFRSNKETIKQSNSNKRRNA